MWARSPMGNSQTTYSIELLILDRVITGNDENKLNSENITHSIVRDLINVIGYSTRWRTFSDFTTNAPSQKYYDEFADAVTGWGVTIDLQVYNSNGICDLPVFDYDFNQPLPDEVCEPVTVTDSDGITETEVPSGGSFQCTLVSPVTVTNSDGTYNETVASGGTLNLPDISFTDSNGVAQSVPSQTDIVATQCTLQIFGADTIATGQTTSYRSGDDGDLQRGRGVDFFIMGYNNGFGNTNRFTDELGTQAYSNSIIIDWSTWNGGANVKAFSLSLNSNVSGIRTWFQWVDGQPYTVNSVNNWYVANIQEIDSVVNWGFTTGLNYPPFNAPTTSGNGLHCTTTPPNSTASALIKAATLPYLSIFPKSTQSRSLLIRMYTLSELGL